VVAGTWSLQTQKTAMSRFYVIDVRAALVINRIRLHHPADRAGLRNVKGRFSAVKLG
jgi:hypothetical protein